MKLRFLLGLICFVLLVAGCSSKPSITLQEEKPLPEWYLNPPSNTATSLSGVGSGSSQEEATKVALNDLLARLGVSIESNFDSKTKVSNFGYSSSTTNTIRSEVAKIRISNYETVATEQIRFNQYVVRVQSDREQFANSLVSELDQKLNAIQQRITNAKNDHALKRYQVAKEAAAEANALMPSLLILNGMEVGFNPAAYFKTLQGLSSQSEQARQSLLFIVKGDAQSQQMLEPIKNALTMQGFLVANQGRHTGVLLITLKTNSHYSTTSGIQIANVETSIHVTDHQNKVVGSNHVALSGHATRGTALAVANAVQKMGKLIEDQGIASVLGLLL